MYCIADHGFLQKDPYSEHTFLAISGACKFLSEVWKDQS